jgi:hypothetical protein
MDQSMTDNIIQFPRSWPLQPWQLGEGFPPGPDSVPARVEHALDFIAEVRKQFQKTKRFLLANEDLLPPAEGLDAWSVKLRMTEMELDFCAAWLRHYKARGYNKSAMWEPFALWDGPDFPDLTVTQ